MYTTLDKIHFATFSCREGRHIGLLGGGLGLGGGGYLQLVYYARILYIRLLYLMRLLQYSGCGCAGGGLGGFSNYFGGYGGGHWRSDLDNGQFQFTDRKLDLNLNRDNTGNNQYDQF